MRTLRRLVYRLGFRPRLGHPLHSPSLDTTLAWKDFGPRFKEAVERGAREADAAIREGGASATTGGVSTFTASGTPPTSDGVRNAIKSALGTQPMNGRMVRGANLPLPHVDLPSRNVSSNPQGLLRIFVETKPPSNPLTPCELGLHRWAWRTDGRMKCFTCGTPRY